jgi:hypothetical protein
MKAPGGPHEVSWRWAEPLAEADAILDLMTDPK